MTQKLPQKGEFAQNVLKLGSANVAAQAISMLAVPVITRLYLPEDYGVFAIYLAVTMVLFPVSNLRFNSAILLPDNRKDAANLLALSILTVTFFSLLLAGIIGLVKAGGYLPEEWRTKGFDSFLWLVPVGVFIQGAAQCILFWALRNKKFGAMATSRLTESITDRCLVLFLGFLGNASALGLILGRIVGPFLGLLQLIRQSLFHELNELRQLVSRPIMSSLAGRYKDFCLFSTPAFFINRFSNQLPLLLLAAFFSPVETGFYALAMRMIQLPMSLVGDSISKVYFQRATEIAGQKDKLARDTAKLMGYLFYLSLPMVLLLLTFGKEVFAFCFGIKWQAAGTYAQILAVAFLAKFLYRPLSTLFDTFEQQQQRLVFNILLLIGNAGAIVLTALNGGTILVALAALTLVSCLIYGGVFIYFLGLLGIKGRQIGRILLTKLFFTAPLIVGLPLSSFYYHRQLFLAFGLTFAIAVLLQGTVIFTFDQDMKKEIGPFVPRMFGRHREKKQPANPSSAE